MSSQASNGPGRERRETHAAEEPFIHRIDTRDKIIYVNSNWSRFAEENGLNAKPGSPVIGSSLWGHISDKTTIYLYQLLIQKVRRTKQPLKVRFRGDSPELRRFMVMEIAHLDPQLIIEFRSSMLRHEKRARLDLLDPKAPRNQDLLFMCVWCKKVKAGEWLEPEDAALVLNLFEQAAQPMISHVTCPACEVEGLKALGE